MPEQARHPVRAQRHRILRRRPPEHDEAKVLRAEALPARAGHAAQAVERLRVPDELALEAARLLLVALLHRLAVTARELPAAARLRLQPAERRVEPLGVGLERPGLGLLVRLVGRGGELRRPGPAALSRDGPSVGSAR